MENLFIWGSKKEVLEVQEETCLEFVGGDKSIVPYG